jgi:putative ABC transport system permease protein
MQQLRTLVVIGLVPGLLLAWTMARALQAFLFGVTATDWRVYVSMSLVLMAVAVLASFFPARRAAAIEPLTALRYE